MDYTIIDISSLSDNEIKVGDWIELIEIIFHLKIYLLKQEQFLMKF